VYGSSRQLHQGGIGILPKAQSMFPAAGLAERTIVPGSGRVALLGLRELKENEHMRRATLGL